MQSCSRKLFAASIAIFWLIGVKSLPNVCQRIVQEPAPDYCEQWGKNHLGCNSDQDIIRCGKAPAEIVPITKELRKKIVRQHNVYRNIVAKGNLRLLPVAARMLKIKWDAQLAYLASLALRSCNLSLPLDWVYSTTSASRPGYNAAYNKYHMSIPQDELKVASAQIKAWFDQYKYVNILGLSANKSESGREIGHFKQLVTGLNDRVGCAILKYPDSPWEIQLMICFYGCRKHDNQVTYALGKVPADKCQCGSDRRFKNLCNKQERYGDCALIKDHSLEDSELERTTTTTTTTTTRKPNRKDLLEGINDFINTKVINKK